MNPKIEGVSLSPPNKAEGYEEVVARVSAIFLKNFITSGLRDQIVQHSAHGVKLVPEEFDSVVIGFETGEYEFAGGVSVQPRLKSGSTPITPKLYRIFTKGNLRDADEVACQNAADQIWDDVSEDDRRSLLKEAIAYAVKKWTVEKESAERLKASEDPDDWDAGTRFFEQADKKLQSVLKLQQDFDQGSVRLTVKWAHASMGAIQ